MSKKRRHNRGKTVNARPANIGKVGDATDLTVVGPRAASIFFEKYQAGFLARAEKDQSNPGFAGATALGASSLRVGPDHSQ